MCESCNHRNVTLQDNNIVRDEKGLLLGRMQKSIERATIVDAVAQAWCASENEGKVMDQILAETIVRNIVNIM